MLTDLQRMLLLGILLNSALYLVAVFAAGIVTHNPVAWKIAIAAMGFASLGYVTQYHQFSEWYFAKAMGPLSWGSIVLGVAAGIALLVK